MDDNFCFTFIYNILREYGRIAPQFTKKQIKDFLSDLKRCPSHFDNFVMKNGDILIKLTMTYPEIFKYCILEGLGKYSSAIDLINWALFCGPTPPSILIPMNSKIREAALNIILDTMDDRLLDDIPQVLNILQYFPSNPRLIAKFLNKLPSDASISNDWILTFIHRGNPTNIPYIVSHQNNREIVYQVPNFLSKSLPDFRQQLVEDESILGPNDTHEQYYNKLAQLQNFINEARPIIRRENWNLIFCISRFIIYIRRFMERYYEPGKGRGYIAGAKSWTSLALNK